MVNLINKLWQLARLVSSSGARARSRSTSELPTLPKVLNEDVIKQLMQMVENTHKTEYTCEETFTLLDEYVELANRNEDLAAIMPLVKHHLEMCVDCREQFETLLSVIQAESSPPPA
jgi:valyl-tRNA synthetase